MSILSPSKLEGSGIQVYEVRLRVRVQMYVEEMSWIGVHVSYHSYILRPRGYPGEAIKFGLIACS
jgi:hypothetical protein